jgi:hypothetical protein
MLLMDFNTWWQTKELFEQVYWAFAVPSTMLFVGILILTFVGGGVEDMDGVDATIEADTGVGFQFFTIKGMIGFFTLFSWSGLACINAGLGYSATLVISILCGLAMMFLLGLLFLGMSKLVESGTLSLTNAVGRIGEVYLPVRSGRANIGQVQINVQGAVRTLQAMTDDKEDLPVGAVIQVTAIISDQILLVTKNTK